MLNLRKSINVINIWFKENYMEAAELIEKHKKLTLEYLNCLIQIKEEQIEKYSKEEIAKVTTESNMYKKLILMYIELLCYFKKSDLLLEFIKRKYCPINEALSICKNYNNKLAEAYIRSSLGEYPEALSAYINILSDQANKLIASQNKADYISLCLVDYKEIYDLAVPVCSKNASINSSDKTLWFKILEHLYELWKKIEEIKQKGVNSLNGTFLEIVPKTLNELIKDLLYIMVQYIPTESIVKEIVKQMGELNIESFRGIFTSMILSYVYQERILDSAVKVQAKSLMKEVEKNVLQRQKAISIKNSTCSFCNNNVKMGIGRYYYTFACGHMFHYYCITSVNICPICSKAKNCKL